MFEKEIVTDEASNLEQLAITRYMEGLRSLTDPNKLLSKSRTVSTSLRVLQSAEREASCGHLLDPIGVYSRLNVVSY